MAKAADVLGMLRPNGGYVQVGEDYEGITFEANCEPLTKEEYLAGFAQYDAWKAQQDEAKATAKAAAEAKLLALGLTADDLKALRL
tara:strand:+ start:367 stop:624 length:258 start_codon:yes stop_codon:yes gene_type:complete